MACIRLSSQHNFARFCQKLVRQLSLSSWSFKNKKNYARACTHTHTHTHKTSVTYFLRPFVLSLFLRFLLFYLLSFPFPRVTPFSLHLLRDLIHAITHDIPLCVWLTKLFLKNQCFSWATGHTSHTFNCLLDFSNCMPKSSSPQHFQKGLSYRHRNTCSPVGIHSLNSWKSLRISHRPSNLIFIQFRSLVSSISSMPLKLVCSSPWPPLRFNTLLMDLFPQISALLDSLLLLLSQ